MTPAIAAFVRAGLNRAVEISRMPWTCRGCGYDQNNGLSEVCDKCWREFLDDGRTARDFEKDPYIA